MHHTWIAANIATKIDGYFGWISWLWSCGQAAVHCHGAIAEARCIFSPKTSDIERRTKLYNRPERRRLLRRRRRIISGAAKLPCTTSIADHDAPPKGTTSNHQVWYSPGLLGMSAGCGMWQPWLGYCRPTGLCTAQRPQCCRPLRRHRGRTCYRPATCHHIHWPFINHTRYTTSSPSEPQPCMVKVVRFPLRIPPTNLISLVSITTHTQCCCWVQHREHTILPFSALSIISLVMFVGATSNR